MPYFLYIRQQGAINRLNREIAIKNIQLNNIRGLISQLDQQLNNEIRLKDTANSENNELNRKIEILKRQIAAEEAKIPILTTQLNKSKDELEELGVIANMSTEEHQVAIEGYGNIEGFNAIAYYKTLATSENQSVNSTLYNDIQSQNTLLSSAIGENRNIATTYDRKTLTENTNTDVYGFYNGILFTMYYLFVLLLLYIAYSKSLLPSTFVAFRASMSFTNTLFWSIIATLILAYPFYIRSLELMIYDTLRYTWALMRGEPYIEDQ